MMIGTESASWTPQGLMKFRVPSPPTPCRSPHHAARGTMDMGRPQEPQVPFSWVPMNTLCTFPYPRALCFLLSGVWGLFASSLFALISHLMIVLHIILFLYSLARVIVFTDKTFVVGELQPPLSTQKYGTATNRCLSPSPRAGKTSL